MSNELSYSEALEGDKFNNHNVEKLREKIRVKREDDRLYLVLSKIVPNFRYYEDQACALIDKYGLSKVLFESIPLYKDSEEVDARSLPSKTIKHAYSGILIVSDAGEELGICNRDSGFEFQYNNIWYEAKCGVLRKLGDDNLEEVELLEKEVLRLQEEYNRECNEKDAIKTQLSKAVELLVRQSPLYWCHSGDMESASQYEKEVMNFLIKYKEN